MATVGDLLTSGTARLRASGSESARLDAELLLGWAIGAERTALIAHPEAPVGADAAAAYEAAVVRREAGEPVAYIRGLKEFYGLAFCRGRASADPAAGDGAAGLGGRARGRLAAALRAAAGGHVRRCGSWTWAPARGPWRSRWRWCCGGGGCCPRSRSWRSICSADALDLAKENAVGHAVAEEIAFAEADLLPAGEPPFDVVLANLPYIPSGDIAGLPVAASFEPRLALDGGPDGLARRETAAGRPAFGSGARGDGPAGDRVRPGAGGGGPVAGLGEGWTCRIQEDLSGNPRLAHVERVAAPAARAAFPGDY